MKPSQKRQLKCWVSIWAKVGGFFLVSMACLSVAANLQRAAALAREQSLTTLNSAVQTGHIRAWSVAAPKVVASSSSSASAATGSASAGSTTAIIANPTFPGGGNPPGVPQTGQGSPLALTAKRELDGTLTLSAPSFSGKEYVLEVSMDLRTWAPVLTNPATGTQIGFAVSNSPTLGMVYYRLSGKADAMLTAPGTSVIFISPIRGD